MAYFFVGPHCGTITEYAENRKRFVDLGDALDYVVSCFDFAFSRDDLYLRVSNCDTNCSKFYILTKRYYDENFILIYGCPQCVGYLEMFYN